MSSKKPSLDDDDASISDVAGITIEEAREVGALQLYETIENLMENKPKQRSKAKPWIRLVNKYIDVCNERFGKIYNKIK